MMDPSAVALDLRAHLALGQEFLQLVERENQSLHSPEGAGSSAFEFFQLRKSLLPRLDQSVAQLKKHRTEWQRLSAADRQRHPEIAALLRANQDLIMKVLVLDRENEQARLRRGLVPPNHLPPAARQRPHYVADLYRRHSQ
jgi:hypothetical protein